VYRPAFTDIKLDDITCGDRVSYQLEQPLLFSLQRNSVVGSNVKALMTIHNLIFQHGSKLFPVNVQDFRLVALAK